MKKYTGIIYMYESPSGKYYIGQTTRPKSRKNEHASMSYNNSELPFHRAIRKYGYNVELAEYSRIIDAAKDNNISQSAISMAISGKKKTAGGYKWKYKEEF